MSSHSRSVNIRNGSSLCTIGRGEILLDSGIDLAVGTPLSLHSVGVFLFEPRPFSFQLFQSG